MIARSSGVVSLLELLKFNAHDYVGIARTISWIETMADEIRRRAPEMIAVFLPAETMSSAHDYFVGMRDELKHLGLDSGEDQMVRLIEMFSTQNPTAQEVAYGLTELQNRIDDQLARRSFYQLRPEVADLFDNEHPFGETITARFPSAAHDIREACKCFACERYDATVYHLSRALESPMRCLASSLHIKYAPGWAGYIRQIDKKLKDTKLKLSGKRRTFLGNASALLWSVKEAWRNDAAHLGKEYGPDQTRKIFDSTRSFMEHLATELKERTT